MIKTLGELRKNRGNLLILDTTKLVDWKDLPDSAYCYVQPVLTFRAPKGLHQITDLCGPDFYEERGFPTPKEVLNFFGSED